MLAWVRAWEQLQLAEGRWRETVCRAACFHIYGGEFGVYIDQTRNSDCCTTGNINQGGFGECYFVSVEFEVRLTMS